VRSYCQWIGGGDCRGAGDVGGAGGVGGVGGAWGGREVLCAEENRGLKSRRRASKCRS
jgi:hypothetical protein